MTAVLEVSDLAKAFGGVQAVDGVSFQVAAGELLALIGPNGAGKTTCFNMLNGQLKPDRGAVTLAGRNITGLPPRVVARLGVGRTFQITATYGSMTVRENVQTALSAGAGRAWSMLARAADRHAAEADALLDLVGMRDQALRACGVLAYGDLKRVELAVALANAPKLLLMDEPTAGMAPGERVALMALAAQIAKARGVAVLFTEHDMDVVFEHADRVIVLDRGRLIADGAPAAVRADTAVRAVYLGTGSTFGGGVKAPAAESSDPLPSQAPPVPHGKKTALLEVRDLHAFYGRAHILHGVSFAIGRGEAVALVGRNGAGKSTTMKAIMGLVPPAQGVVVFDGASIAGRAPFEIARAGLGYVPEERRIFAELSVLENLTVGERPPRPDAPRWTAQALFDLFPNLGRMPDRPGGRMSGGEQQMLTIARTLMGNPSFVLLDEPSEGLSPLLVEQMAKAILRMKAEGLAVLVSEQNLHFAGLVADRALVMEKGEIRFDGTMRELLADAAIRADISPFDETRGLHHIFVHAEH